MTPVLNAVIAIGSTVSEGGFYPMPADRRWYAVYTVSNHEKRAEEFLRAKDVEVYLPLYSVTRRWKNRTSVKLSLPLFTGYLFAKIAPSERGKVLEVPAVMSIVGSSRGPTPVSDVEIETLKSGLQLRQVDPCPYLKVGNRARIRSGPLAGLEGVVLRRDDSLRVVVTIESIMRSFAVHVNADEVEACGIS